MRSSLRSRLARHDRLLLRLLFPQALTSALMLMLLSLVSFNVLQRNFLMHDREVLSDGTSLIETILRGKDNVPEVLQDELPRDLAAFEHTHFLLEVQTLQGVRLYRSLSFPEVPAEVWAGMPFTPERKAAQVTPWASSEGRTYNLCKAECHLGQTQSQPVLLRLAIDTTRTTRTLDAYRRSLFMVAAGGIIIGLLINWAIAVRGLQPLAQMTRMVADIRLHYLHRRVSGKGWPTEVTVLADAFNTLLGEIESGVARLSGFCSDLAHEFRTPLTNLRMEAELALETSRSSEEYRQVLQSVLEEIERLSSIVDRLLLLARLEHEAITMEPLDLAQALKRLVEYYRLVAEDRGVSITATLDESVGIPADPTLMEIALGNVLSNAVSFAKSRVSITLWRHESSVGIEITDDGEGVESQHLPNLGTRFYRVDPVRSGSGRHRPSHGLGLALVRTTVNLHGGHMEISSKVGEGTTVRLHLPDPHRPPTTDRTVTEAAPGALLEQGGVRRRGAGRQER